MPSETAQNAGVTIAIADAERIYGLYEIVQFADRHFHGCQSASFRQHVVGVCAAPNVRKSFDDLKNRIDRAKGGD